jgi:hypothetical protein
MTPFAVPARTLRTAVALACLSLMLTACGGAGDPATPAAAGGSDPAGPATAARGGAEGDPSSLTWKALDPREPGVQGPVFHGASVETKAVSVPKGDPVKGAWSPVLSWPIIGIHSVLLPDGRVLTYGTTQTGIQGAGFVYDIWNPAAGTGASSHLTLPNGTSVDTFCASQVLLPTGNVQIFGGDVDNAGRTTNTPNDSVTLFRPANNSLTKIGKMNRLRWYSTSTTLLTGEVLVQGGSGGADLPEIRGTDGQFRLLTGAPTSNLASSYPRNVVQADGKVFGFSNRDMYRIDPRGSGAITSLGSYSGNAYGWTSSSVMYAPGRILQSGGSEAATATADAILIDIRGATPAITAAPKMTYPRHWGSSTVLADGRVAVTGGAAGYNVMTGVAYAAELFDPKTGKWTVGANAVQARLYHSTALLLPDASVLVAGGGAPGPQTNLNAEIYFPPYLYAADGRPATRPTIASAPSVVEASGSFALGSPDAASIKRVTLVRSGSVTHSNNMDQRFLDLAFTASGTTLNVSMPTDAGDVPPGFYMVFAINASGVPSIAKIVRVNVSASAAAALSAVAVSPAGGAVAYREFSGNAWKAWSNLGGQSQHVPSIANDVTGGWLAVYATAADGRILRRQRTDAGWSSGWADTGLAAWWPASATQYRGDAWVAWIDWNLGISVRSWNPSAGDGAATALGGSFVSGAKLAKGGDGLLYAMGLGTNGAIQVRAFDGTTWSPWTSLTGAWPMGEFNVTTTATGVQVFIRGTDQVARTVALARGVAGPWTVMGNAVKAAPRGTMLGSAIVAGAVGTDGATSVAKWVSGSWSPWSPLAGVAEDAVGAAGSADGQVVLVVRNAANQLYETQWDTAHWQAWRQVAP